MSFLADENFRPALQALREAGFDVAWISESHSGACDEEVLARSAAEKRTLLTFDKGFGELAFRQGLPAGCGIVLFRLVPQDPTEAASIAVAAIKSRANWGRALQRSHTAKDSHDRTAGAASGRLNPFSIPDPSPPGSRPAPPCLQQQSQALPRSASAPSRAMMGTMVRPATGSAHHQPSAAFKVRPTSRIAKR